MMNRKVIAGLTLVLALVFVGAVYAGSLGVYHNAGMDHGYTVGKTFDNSVWSWNYHAQTFTVGDAGINVTNIVLPLSKLNNDFTVGTVIVQIREVDANGKPTLTVLGQGTISGDGISKASSNTDASQMSWYTINIDKMTLQASTMYALVMQAPEAETSAGIMWWADETYSGYADGACYITFQGNQAVWFTVSGTVDYGFELWDFPFNQAPGLVDPNMIVGLMFCVGLGAIGFAMGKGKDSTPALFMMIVGFVLFWQIGYLPSWIPIVSIAILSILLASRIKGMVGH